MYDDFRQSENFQHLLENHGFIVAGISEHQVGYIQKRKLVPFLSTMIVPRIDNADVLDQVDDLAKKFHAVYVSVTPKVNVNDKTSTTWQRELEEHGFKPSTFGAAPTKTLIIDLSLTEEELLNHMKSKTRYNINLCRRRGAKIKSMNGDELISTHDLLQESYKVYAENCKRIHSPCEPLTHFEEFINFFHQQIFQVLVYSPTGNMIAMATFIVSGDTISYQMNGSTEEGRHLFAPSLAVWQGMCEGKKRGCRWFDFDGIYDDRFPKGQKYWEGFTAFKKGFGGREVTYLEPYIKWLPFLKKAH